ncbi:uncharacterized protein LOC117288380 [Asterias rubens]|uniref:uncharacterized protein LOC117288380 n=1 Tax=Asterias rubens TaxID=7604 RepID=UPI0014557D56|nr:uncharacterized protein LOC117288380 [Asterias rubens]
MGYYRMSLPSLWVVMLFVLTTILIINTSTTNATSCATLNCVDVSTAACRFCRRRGGKRSANYAWRDDRELDESNDRGSMTSECFLDTEVARLPHDLQEQVYEVLEVVLGMNR